MPNFADRARRLLFNADILVSTRLAFMCEPLQLQASNE
jgi:hypothetical protein